MAVAFGVLSFWRDEGPSDGQPPQLIADVLDWLPWYTWTLVALLAALLVVMESAYKFSETNEVQRDDLIKATPAQDKSQTPVGQGRTATEVIAYLDVTSFDPEKPLRNCRVKLLELLHYMAYTDRTKGEVVERWDRDSFYAGQTYFFRWSGRGISVDAVDVQSSERAVIATCLDSTNPELATTAGPVGHISHGDQYHLTLEISADNSRPVIREYRLQMHQSISAVIEEWDASRTSWL